MTVNVKPSVVVSAPSWAYPSRPASMSACVTVAPTPRAVVPFVSVPWAGAAVRVNTTSAGGLSGSVARSRVLPIAAEEASASVSPAFAETTGGSFTGVTVIDRVTGELDAWPSETATRTDRAGTDGASLEFV